MTNQLLGTRLRLQRTINLTPNSTPITGKLDKSNQDAIYRFKLKSSGNLNFQLDGLGSKANLELIKDSNGNGRIDSGEVVTRARARSGKLGLIDLKNTQPGTFFLRVSARGQEVNYSLLSTVQENLSTGTVGTPPGTPGGGTSPSSPTPPPTGSGTPAPSFADQVVSLVNTIRQQNGLRSLTKNDQLTNSAQSHSQNMAVQDFFSHTGADNSSPFQRMQTAGYRYSFAGENIAAGQMTPQSVVDSWMNSSGHRANILSSNFSEIGVGHYYLANDTGSTNYNHYWTQNFGSPMN